MITLKLARGDNYESVPLRLPTTPGEVDEVFAALDAASRYAGEVQIIGVDSGVPSLAKHLKGAGLTDPDAFDKLNRLAEKIDGMDERQRDIFSGALDAESAGSLDDVLRVSDSLEAYTFVPNVRSDEELGRYVVVAGQLHGDRRFPEEAWPYLDFAKIGAEYFAGHGGAYTVSGYVMRRENGQQQVQESKPIFELYLLHGQIRYCLDLPAEELQLDMTKRSLGVEDFAQAAIYQTRCEMEPLAGLLPMDCVSVESANELARTIREMPDGDLLKYLAVLSVEPPADFPGALRLALELDDYERITEGSYEYGQSVLRRIGADEELISVIDGYKQYSAWIGVQTSLGEIEKGVWYQAAEALIQKAGEQKLLEALTDWESRHNYAKDSARTVRHKALQLHISRIFDNPRWVNFIPFNREYRPEVLEHASLVTVINECCGKPGEVTQEQIDGACTGTVACPHCGRWSSFSIVEPKQAEEQGMEMI